MAQNRSLINRASIPEDSVARKADGPAVLPFGSLSFFLLAACPLLRKLLLNFLVASINFGDMVLRSTFDSKNGCFGSRSDDNVKSSHDSQSMSSPSRFGTGSFKCQ